MFGRVLVGLCSFGKERGEAFIGLCPRDGAEDGKGKTVANACGCQKNQKKEKRVEVFSLGGGKNNPIFLNREKGGEMPSGGSREKESRLGRQRVKGREREYTVGRRGKNHRNCNGGPRKRDFDPREGGGRITFRLRKEGEKI